MTQTRKIKFSLTDNKGLTLATSIILIVFASTAVLSVTTFIIERLSQAEMKHARTKALYLAQAGIHNAIYFYRFRDIAANGYFSLGQTNVDANNYFVTGGAGADLLMVNTSTAAIGGAGNVELQNLRIQNATNSKTITIARMIVTWNNSNKLKRIYINGVRVWTGNKGSPNDADLNPDFVLDMTPSLYPVDYLEFNGNMSGSTINIQFIMSDGSTTSTRQVYPASLNFNFTVNASGKTTGSAISRTIRAEYNSLTNKIFNYYEIANP